MTESITDILNEARERFRRSEEWYGEANRRWLADYKFANGDPDNLFQWPNEIMKSRVVSERPLLTINKTRQHNLQIINNGLQNKPGIAIRPVGNGATFKAAQCLEGIVRHIEYQSNAPAIYSTASGFQVIAGAGYWRIITDYIDEQSFDQEIFIRPIQDPLSVYLDPDCKERDKSDAEFGFIFEDIPRERFDRDYPKYKDIGGNSVLGNYGHDWISKDHVRQAEYFRKVIKDDKLIEFDIKDQNGQVTGRQIMLASEFKGTPELKNDLMNQDSTRVRSTTTTIIEWKYIVGDKIIDSKIWLGNQIPIVEVVGEETVIEGRLDRKGHTRALKDAQRMYNYWSSTAVEYGALQTKTPWIAPASAIEGYTELWNNANKENLALLPWNHMGEDGQPIPKPERVEPPVAAPVAIQGMQIAAGEMMMASGQYEADFGAQGNERSAKAINERQAQGDTATYHFIDNLALSIRRTGKIILDLIPKIYDTERVIMIMAEDGTTAEVLIDPTQKQAYVQQQVQNQETAKLILNPNVGKYEVQADVGPAYGTKRQEAFNAFTILLTQAPQLVAVIGDLLLKAGDFPLADEAAERLRRMVPPQALGQGPSQNELVLMQQLEQAKGIIAKMLNEAAVAEVKLQGKQVDGAIGWFDAVTKRLKVIGDHTTDLATMKNNIQQMLLELDADRQRLAQAKTADQEGGDTAPELATRLSLKYGPVLGEQNGVGQ